MDQLKPAIAWIKTNIFWIGCFFLAATMIGSWIFSANQLASAQKKRQTAIDKQINALNKVTKTTAEDDLPDKAHPNDSTQAGMDAEIDRTIASIVRAWTKRYKEQQAILKWPEDLGDETVNFFSQIDVPEKVNDLGKGFEKYRKAYYDRIPNYMNRICDDLGVNWKYNEERNEEERKKRLEEMAEGGGNSFGYGGGDGMGGGGGMGGKGGMGGGGMGGGGMGGGFGNANDTTLLDEINRYPVNWDDTNQALWQQKLKTFQGYDDHSGASLYPTYMQANMLQQDLWLLEAMFKNIKQLNGVSTSNDTSNIRTIDHIVFGREATAQLGKLSPIDARLAGAGTGIPGGMMGGEGQMGGPGMEPGMGGMEAAMAEAYGGGYGGGMGGGGGPGEGLGDRSAYDARYVNPNLETIAAADVRAVLGGSALPDSNLELIVAKRVPFRLAVDMDERKINEFISICANSEFVFEINQLRINRHDTFPGAIAFNGGSNASAGGFGKMEGSRGGGGMGGGGKGPAGSQLGSTTKDLDPTPVESRKDFMVAVEFYGIVKIYNPVRENFLRLAAGQDVVDDTADPSMEAPQGAAAAAAEAGQPAAAPAAQGDAATPADGAPAAPAANADPEAAAPAEQPAGAPAPEAAAPAPDAAAAAGGAAANQ